MDGSDSDSSGLLAPDVAFRHPFGDIFSIWEPDAVEQAIEQAILSDNDSYFGSDDDMFDSGDELHPEDGLVGFRFDRRVATYAYDGDVLRNLNNLNPDEALNWRSLPDDIRDARWMSEFRMPEPVFDELYALVSPGMDESFAPQPGMRQYSKRDRLLITLHFLAHVPTLRAMSTKFGAPHNSISRCILHPTLKAMLTSLFHDPDTRVINFPRTEDELKAVMSDYHELHSMPGCIGAIDGSGIPQRKPTKVQAGGDRDAWWMYKGHVASLLLAIVDAKGLFLYVSSGSPSTAGDAGLWARSALKAKFDDGLPEAAAVELEVDDDVSEITGYLVGDAAFAKSKYMMKCIDPPPPLGSAEAKYNRCVINARRGVERSFGILKGRFAFCDKNTFYGAPQLTRTAILVCCCLHNFLTVRAVPFDDRDIVQLEEIVWAPNYEPNEDGEAVQDVLVAWCNANT